MNKYDVSLIYNNGITITKPYLRTNVEAENKEEAAQKAKEEVADMICANTTKNRERVMKYLKVDCVVEAIYQVVCIDAHEAMRG